jgi:hypothetical protein
MGDKTEVIEKTGTTSTLNGLLSLPVEEREAKDNCAKDDCFFYSGAIRTHCKLRDEHRRMCGKYIPFTAHKGDPCEYCGEAHNEIKRGPCPKRVKQR